MAAFLLGVAAAGISQPEPEPEIRTVTQVSERPVWTPECEKIPNQSERRQCERIIAGYDKSLQSATTTTTVALDCDEVNGSGFTVLPPDPHGFDGNSDGVGCES